MTKDGKGTTDPDETHQISRTAEIPHRQELYMNGSGEFEVVNENDCRDERGFFVRDSQYECTCGFYTEEESEARDHLFKVAREARVKELVAEIQTDDLDATCNVTGCRNNVGLTTDSEYAENCAQHGGRDP